MRPEEHYPTAAPPKPQEVPSYQGGYQPPERYVEDLFAPCAALPFCSFAAREREDTPVR